MAGSYLQSRLLVLNVKKGACLQNHCLTTRVRGNAGNGETTHAHCLMVSVASGEVVGRVRRRGKQGVDGVPSPTHTGTLQLHLLLQDPMIKQSIRECEFKSLLPFPSSPNPLV